MRLFEYLVPSRARRELLKALRSQSQGVTVRRLARLAGVVYSSAHREVEQMRRVGLLGEERRGNALVCSWKADHPAARALNPLLQDSTRAGEAGNLDDATVFWNLKRWGAPLVRAGRVGERLTLESTLAHALALARRHSDLARVWPVVLAVHRAEADLPVLAFLARRLGQKRALGFFLTLTGRMLKDAGLVDTGRRLRDDRCTRTEDFFLPALKGRARTLAERRTPSAARKWRFRMNMPLETFESTFRKFVHPP